MSFIMKRRFRVCLDEGESLRYQSWGVWDSHDNPRRPGHCISTHHTLSSARERAMELERLWRMGTVGDLVFNDRPVGSWTPITDNVFPSTPVGKHIAILENDA